MTTEEVEEVEEVAAVEAAGPLGVIERMKSSFSGELSPKFIP